MSLEAIMVEVDGWLDMFCFFVYDVTEIKGTVCEKRP